jgi:hypothetical protein
MQTVREMMTSRKDCIDVAARVAPYCHPKQEAVSVKTESVHKFCIVAPAVIEDANEWLAKCHGELRAKAVAVDLNINRAIEQAKKADLHKSQPIEEDDNPLDEIPE